MFYRGSSLEYLQSLVIALSLVVVCLSLRAIYLTIVVDVVEMPGREQVSQKTGFGFLGVLFLSAAQAVLAFALYTGIAKWSGISIWGSSGVSVLNKRGSIRWFGW